MTNIKKITMLLENKKSCKKGARLIFILNFLTKKHKACKMKFAQQQVVRTPTKFNSTKM